MKDFTYYATNTYPITLTKHDVIPFIYIKNRFIPLSNDNLDCEIQDYKFIVRSDLFEDIK